MNANDIQRHEIEARYPGATATGPEAQAAIQAAQRAKAAQPPPIVYVAELCTILGLRNLDAYNALAPALARLGLPSPLIKYELQKFPKAATETLYWERFALTSWLESLRDVMAVVKLK